MMLPAPCGPRPSTLAAAVLLAVLAWTAPALARDLVFGLESGATTLDPHFLNIAPNNTALRHIFEPLIERDERLRLHPALAASWQRRDDLTWEFRIRSGVTFHDGTPFTAADAAASLDRVRRSDWSGSFANYAATIAEARATDPQTLIVVTKAPDTLLPNRLSNLMMVKQSALGLTHEAFDDSTAAIGTGPYRPVEWVRGERLTLELARTPWREAPPWRHLVIRTIPDAANRVAALLLGEVNLIDQVPPAKLNELAARRTVRLAEATSTRLIFLHLDQARDSSPFVADAEGKALAANPLKDLRVRRAISKAIDRPGIVGNILYGRAVPAGQLLPEGYFGVSPTLQPEGFDLGGARALLAAAGYRGGFKATLHCPSGRYQGDAQICQAVATMLNRAGLLVTPVTMPVSAYFPKLLKHEFSLMLMGWATVTGEASFPLSTLVESADPARGSGSWNAGRYANPVLDALMVRAVATFDEAERARLLARAMEVAMEDCAIVPLHFQVNTWATDTSIRYSGTVDDLTLVRFVTPTAAVE